MVDSSLLTSRSDRMAEYSYRIHDAHIFVKPVKCVQVSRSGWELQGLNSPLHRYLLVQTQNHLCMVGELHQPTNTLVNITETLLHNKQKSLHL